jgi:O-antigen/teichoic acid export membrane protein
LAPKLSQLHKSGDINKFKRLLKIAAWQGFIISLVLTLGILLFKDFLLNLFGAEFKQASQALVILVIGQVVNSSTGPVGFSLTMTGKERIVLIVVGISSVLNVILNLILIPRLGIEGAAISTSITIIFWNAILAIYSMIKLKINTTIFNFY